MKLEDTDLIERYYNDYSYPELYFSEQAETAFHIDLYQLPMNRVPLKVMIILLIRLGVL